MAERRNRADRVFLAEQANGCCEYCMTPEAFSPNPFSVEHIIPRSRRGGERRSNLAFACVGCNNFKYTFVEARDPSSGRMSPLFSPRTQRWTDQFAWDDSFIRIVGLTPVGRATVGRLQLNRLGLRNLRAALYAVGQHPPMHSFAGSGQ
jgi:hypothetical protein